MYEEISSTALARQSLASDALLKDHETLSCVLFAVHSISTNSDNYALTNISIEKVKLENTIDCNSRLAPMPLDKGVI